MRMVVEVRSEHVSEWAAMESVAQKLGIGTTKRLWSVSAEIDVRSWSRAWQICSVPAGQLVELDTISVVDAAVLEDADDEDAGVEFDEQPVTVSATRVRTAPTTPQARTQLGCGGIDSRRMVGSRVRGGLTVPVLDRGGTVSVLVAGHRCLPICWILSVVMTALPEPGSGNSERPNYLAGCGRFGCRHWLRTTGVCRADFDDFGVMVPSCLINSTQPGPV